jgi:hypothetical protein
LRSTSRFSSTGVPNALNLELNFLGLFEVVLVLAIILASWRGRVVLHCSRRNSPSPLRLACCARGGVVLYRRRGRPPNPPSPLRSASTLRLAFLCAWPCCVHRSRGDPRTPLLRCARPRRCALKSSARGRAVMRVRACFLCEVCVCVSCDGVPPLSLSLSLSFSLSLCCFYTFQHSAISMRRRIKLTYSNIHRCAALCDCEA